MESLPLPTLILTDFIISQCSFTFHTVCTTHREHFSKCAVMVDGGHMVYLTAAEDVVCCKMLPVKHLSLTALLQDTLLHTFPVVFLPIEIHYWRDTVYVLGARLPSMHVVTPDTFDLAMFQTTGSKLECITYVLLS